MRYDAFISYSHAADRQLAPRLQDGLQRLARPWWRRRSLNVFRDDTGLTANPGLWSSIAAALDDSEWFVFLASPDAAASPWVEREITHWMAHRDVDHLLPVLTAGEWVWDDARNAFDMQRSTAVPPALCGVFREEPRYIDLRWAHTEEQVDLRHPQFRDEVAAVAAPIHGLAKDELVGEDIRQHRRTLRWAWGAALALVLLTVGSALATVLAVRNADAAQQAEAEAQANAAEAEENATKADSNAAEAAANAQRALDNAAEAERNANQAREQEDIAEQNAAEASRQQSAAEASAIEAQVQAAEASRQARAALQARDAESAARADQERQTQIARQAEQAARDSEQQALHQEQVALYQRAAAEFSAANEKIAREAEEAARREEQAARQTAETEALASASRAQRDQDPALSLLLAVEAERLGSRPDARTASGLTAQGIDPQRSAVGRRALFEAVTSARGEATLHPIDRFLPLPADLDSPPFVLWRPAVSPDGRWLAAAEFPDLVRGLRALAEGTPLPSRVFVWDLTGATPPKVLNGHEDVVVLVEFAGNGTLVTQDASDTVANTAPTTRIWDVATGQQAMARHALPYIDPTGRSIALQAWIDPAAPTAPTVELVDAATRTTKWLRNGSLFVDPLAAFGPDGAEATPWIERPFSRDGRYALGRNGGTAVLWDLEAGGGVEIRLAPVGASSSNPTVDPTGTFATAIVNGTEVWFFRPSDGAPFAFTLPAGANQVFLGTAWSPDGSQLVVLVLDYAENTSYLLSLNVSTGATWLVPSPLGDVGFAGDGQLVTVTSDAGDRPGYETSVFDAVSGFRLPTVDGQLLAISFGADSKAFAQDFDFVGFDEGNPLFVPTFLVTDLSTGATISADGPEAETTGLAIDRTRSLLAVTTVDGVTRVWDLRADVGPRMAAGADTAQYGLAFDTKGERLYGVGIGALTTIWDPTSVGAATVEGTAVDGATVLGDGVTVAEPAAGGAAVVLRHTSGGGARSGPAIPPDRRVDHLVSATASGPLVANLDDPATAAPGDGGSVVAVPDGPVLGSLPGHVVHISYDGSRLAVRRPDREIDVVATDGLATVGAIDLADLPAGLDGFPDTVVLDRTGRRLAATNSTGEVVVWNVATGHVITRMESQPADATSTPLYGLAFSPLGDRLVAKSPSNLLRMWETSFFANWKLLATEQLPVEFAGRVAFSPDGSLVAVDGLFLFDGSTLDPVATLVGSPGSLMRFSADGTALVTIDDAGTIRRWASGTNELVDTACRLAGRNMTRTEWVRYMGDERYRNTCPQYDDDP